MGLVQKLTNSRFLKRTALTASALFLLTSCATLPIIPKLKPRTYQRCDLEGRLRTGVAKNKVISEINTDLKIPVAGFGPQFKDKIAEGIHDDVYTRAVILDNGYKKIGIVNADIVIMSRELKKAVEEKVKEANLDGLLMIATHTHSGPGGYVDNYLAEVVCTGHYQQQLFNNLVEKISKTIIEANKNLEFSKIGSGKDFVYNLSRSRRSVETPIDPELGVIKVENLEGNPKAYIVNFAAHPTSLGQDNRQISADFPGYMAKYLEEDEGVVAIFMNGALGDITAKSPSPYKNKFEKAQKIGRELADKVLELSKRIGTKENVKLNSLATVFDLPSVKLYKPFGLFAFLVKKYLPRDAVLQVVEIDNTVIVGTPCDLCSEVGLEIKEKSKYKNTFVVSQANDYFGYVMPKNRYKEGGYEARMHFHGPKVAELLIKNVLEMIGYLKDD